MGYRSRSVKIVAIVITIASVAYKSILNKAFIMGYRSRSVKIVAIVITIALLSIIPLYAVYFNSYPRGDALVEAYKIGAIFSTTGGGSNLGVPEENTVNMVVDQINDGGGINGHPLEVIIYNDETNSEKCVTLATKLIEQDEVLAIIGPTTSGSSLSIIDTVTKAEIPLVSCAANIGIIEPISERYWVFKTLQTDKEAIAEIYRDLASISVYEIAIITNTSGFGATGRDILITDADDYGIAIVDDQTFNEGDTSMQSQLTHIKGTSAEAVVCWDTDKGSAIVALDMQTLQMEIPLFCSHGIANMAFIDAAGAASNGVIFPGGKLLIVDDIPATDPQKDVLTQYRDDYEALYGVGTINTFGGHAWDALKMVVMALEQMGEGLNLTDARAAIRDNIEQITNFAGISGIFTMSPTNHLGMQPGSLALIKIVDEEWSLRYSVSEYIPTPTPTLTAKDGDTVKVLYTGTLDDGTVFDSSKLHGGDPLEFTIGEGRLIPAFEQAVIGLRINQSITVHIPADEAYGPYDEEKIFTLDWNQMGDYVPEVGEQLSI